MDFSVLLIGLITIAVLVLPFFISYRSGSNKIKRYSNLFIAKSTSEGLTISQHDLLNFGVIGIDKIQNKVAYWPLDQDQLKVIDLNKIASCRLKNVTRTVGTKKEGYTVTDSINLEFNFNNKKESFIINLYDSTSNFQLRGELQMAEKWQKIVSAELKERVEYINGSLV